MTNIEKLIKAFEASVMENQLVAEILGIIRRGEKSGKLTPEARELMLKAVEAVRKGEK